MYDEDMNNAARNARYATLTEIVALVRLVRHLTDRAWLS